MIFTEKKNSYSEIYQIAKKMINENYDISNKALFDEAASLAEAYDLNQKKAHHSVALALWYFIKKNQRANDYTYAS